MTQQPPFGLKPPPDTHPSWLVSLVDTISLMLTFFILQFAMQTMDQQQWYQITKPFRGEASPLAQPYEFRKAGTPTISGVFRRPAVNLDYLAALLQNETSKDERLKGGRFQVRGETLVFSLPSDTTFVTGQAALTPRGLDAVKALAPILRNIRNELVIYGHTDPSPVRGQGSYGDNWELSIGRAQQVAAALIKEGYERPIASLGFAETRLSEINSGLSLPERYALARRVDMVLYPTQP